MPKETELAETDYSETYTEFLVKKPKWNLSGMDDYQAQSSKVISELMDRFNEPSHIPALTEMCSNMLVLCAEQNFETTQPKKSSKQKKSPSFSPEHREAYLKHEVVCKEWRMAGRPSDNSHPAKSRKLESQRNIQRIARDSESAAAVKLHNELMDTHRKDISKVCQKLKQIRGDNFKRIDIPYIETLCGKYSGENILEGFSANTEFLCNENIEISTQYDAPFYNMCVKDNQIIFEITSQETVNIPQMTLNNLKDILFKKLKLGKACDVFKLSVEHLRFAGDETLILILRLLNLIIDNISYLSSPQLNTAVASVVFKGKDKPVTHHKSYRLVRVTPMIGRLIDEHIRPTIVAITRPMQSPSQYGFTANVTYLMGALQRHECEKFCLDMKKTFFGCSLDGDSAFEVVNRVIQTRELYMSGVKGDYWQASHSSYQDSLTKIKMNGNLSREIEENLGVKQGHINSSDQYKVYIGPCLETLEEAQLGVWIGPINSGVSGCADDVFLGSDDPVKLQALIDIAAHYGSLYRIRYGASKTKITVSGPEIDIKYYADTQPWKMDGKTINVVENNDHLGQIVSGIRQEEKNIELRIKKSQNSLFALLGPAFSFRCLLSPVVKMHLYRTFVCPVLRSGLSSLVVNNTLVCSLSIFQRKSLKGVLKVSTQASTAGIHFLTGEIPIEAKIHKDVFSLFFSVWSNPDSKIYAIVKHILSSCNENSRTWANFIRQISRQYGLEDPLSCLEKDPPSKSTFKNSTDARINAFHEGELRRKANMEYLNVSLLGLSGRHHPALSGIFTTLDVKRSRSHLKMLISDLYTYEVKSVQSGGSPNCRLCSDKKIENNCHILTFCSAYSDVRMRILPEYSYLCLNSKSGVNFEDIVKDNQTLCQFILDPTSMNLQKRIALNDPLLGSFFSISRDLCFSITERRLKLLKEKEKNNK